MNGEISVLTATTTANVVIDVIPVADKPTAFVPGNFVGTEDTPINLAGVMGGALADTDGSEALTFKLEGVPVGSVFKDGSGTTIATADASGIVTFTSAQMTAGFSFVPPLNVHTTPGNEWVLTLTSYATEGENNDQAASDPHSFTIKINAVADNPLVTGNSVVDEDFTVVHIGADTSIALFDTDGSEHITSFTVKDLPAHTFIGYTLSGDVTVTETTPGVYVFTSSNADLSVAQTQLQAVLATVDLKPDAGFPANSDVDLHVTIAATTKDADLLTTGTLSVDHPITVRAVADAPIANASGTGVEDTTFKIALSADLVDTDGSETLSAILTGIPAGWTITVAGTTLTSGGTADLAGAHVVYAGGKLTFTAATEAELDAIMDTVYAKAKLNQSGTFAMTLDVTATEAASGTQLSTGHQSETVTKPFDVIVAAVADTPTLKVQPATGAASGHEDQPLKLNFTASLTDKDGSETVWIELKVPLSLTGGPPKGVTFSDASGNLIGNFTVDAGGNEIWRFSPAEHAVLHVNPPLDSNESFSLQMRAIAIESNHPAGFPGKDTEAATAWQTIPIEIKGVADTPTLTVDALTTPEDQPIPLGSIIHGAIVDTDIVQGRSQSETLSFVISGLPGGVIPSVGIYIGNNRWQVTEAQLASLTIPAPANFSGDYVLTFAPGLTVTAVTQENDGSQTSKTVSLVDGSGHGLITLSPVADGFTGWTPAVSENLEDTDIPLINVAFTGALLDADGSETIVSYTLDLNGVIASAEIGGLVTGTADLIANYLKGTFTDNGDGTITVLAANVAGLGFDKAAFKDSNVDFSIPVSALIRDTAGALHDDRVETGSFTIDLKGVADTPTVFAGDMTNDPADMDYSGATGTIIDVNTAGMAFGGATTDTDQALGRAPSESIFYIVSGIKDNANLQLAFVNSAGTIIGLNNGDGTWFLSEADLADLHVKGRASGINGVFETVELTLTTVATENDGDVATNAAKFRVGIDPPAAGGGGIEPFPPIVTIGPMNGIEDGVLTLDNIFAVADPADPSAPDTSVTVIISNLPAGCTVTGAILNPVTGQLFASATELAAGHVKIKPPADFSGTLTFTVEAIATNGDLLQSSSKDLPGNPNTGVMYFEPVADGPNISATPAAGIEDTAVALNLSITLKDTTPDENGNNYETLGNAVFVTVPAGVTLSAGTFFSSAGGLVTYQLTPAEAAALTVTPAPNMHGAFDVTVTSSSTEPANGDTKSSTKTFTIDVTAVGDQPVLAAANSSGDEDTTIALTGLAAHLVDTDGSEVLSLKISGIPAETILIGPGVSNNGDGSWTIPAAALATLSLKPPKDFSGTMTLTLEGFGLETSNGSAGHSTLDFDVVVNPKADPVAIFAKDVTSTEGADITLDLGLKLQDTSGSLPGENPAETLKVTFAGVPDAVTLAAPAGGTLTFISASHTWVFEGSVLESKSIHMTSSDYSGDFTVTATAVAIDNGVEGTPVVDSFDVKLSPVADTASLVVNGASGLAATAIPLDIFADLSDTDGSESISIKISGMPAGAVLNHGIHNGDGSWTLTPAQLVDLTITPAAGQTTFNLAVEATVTDVATGHPDSILIENGNVTVTIGTADQTITGNAFDNTLLGGGGNDTINALAGNDSLNGGAGNDTMAGGAGDDVYRVDNAGDVVTETAGAGTDTVLSSITIAALAANVENLTLTGSSVINGTGNGLHNVIVGNSAANQLDGGAGDDTLSGGAGNDTLNGGTGADILTGGAGSDIYVWHAGETGALDKITDFAAGAGGDVISLHDLLPGYIEGTSDIHQFVQLTQSAGKSTISIDASGSGSFTASLIELQGITGVTLDQLKAANNLVA